ncbi:MAG TPA: aldo/keto reductase, partial [Planctomycetota bacterium]|nr:aldo/keto reductase [Planctomycetota bacterium]
VTTYSPLAHGLLTGKYEAGIPAGSRLDAFPHLRAGRTDEAVAAARRLGALARELGATPAQLAIAWCLGDRRVSSVIVAATTPEQLRENLEVAERPELDEETLHRIASV